MSGAFIAPVFEARWWPLLLCWILGDPSLARCHIWLLRCISVLAVLWGEPLLGGRHFLEERNRFGVEAERFPNFETERAILGPLLSAGGRNRTRSCRNVAGMAFWEGRSRTQGGGVEIERVVHFLGRRSTLDYFLGSMVSNSCLRGAMFVAG